jgi:hypothetical protein
MAYSTNDLRAIYLNPSQTSIEHLQQLLILTCYPLKFSKSMKTSPPTISYLNLLNFQSWLDCGDLRAPRSLAIAKFVHRRPLSRASAPLPARASGSVPRNYCRCKAWPNILSLLLLLIGVEAYRNNLLLLLLTGHIWWTALQFQVVVVAGRSFWATSRMAGRSTERRRPRTPTRESQPRTRSCAGSEGGPSRRKEKRRTRGPVSVAEKDG